jgi:serine/threonine protein kinase
MERSNEHIGKYYGNYLVVDEIMSGAFGCVYLAQHEFLRRAVAIKFLHENRLHLQSEWDQFFLEAEFLEQLRHPHILTIYDFGTDGTYPYIISEYAAGGSLCDMLQRRHHDSVPLEEAITILEQIGDALYHAHRQGIVHRDLKPGNILFNKSHDALLADFGIAIMMKSPAKERRVSLVGTPTYMAPEQFHGIASPYSDQYALGCIAYELLTGRPPFVAPDAVSFGYQHRYNTPMPPTLWNSQIPSYVEQAILTALEKNPRNRHTGIASFISALHAQPVYRRQRISPHRVGVSHSVRRTARQFVN